MENEKFELTLDEEQANANDKLISVYSAFCIECP